LELVRAKTSHLVQWGFPGAVARRHLSTTGKPLHRQDGAAQTTGNADTEAKSMSLRAKAWASENRAKGSSFILMADPAHSPFRTLTA